mgnify:CR=1 FL=1
MDDGSLQMSFSMPASGPHPALQAADGPVRPPEPLRLWTIGHSSHPLDEFIALLQGQQIGCLADVRRYPGSRAHPHFNVGPLAAALARVEIDYQPFTELGGRRKARPGSTNTVWRNASFRGYADYMETPEFRAGLERLLALAAQTRCAIMCSEALWWRCHRSLIADVLKARGDDILHIMGGGTVTEHPYTSAAQVEDGHLHYGSAPV